MTEIVYMPSGRPAPLVMTPDEAAELLRIEGVDVKDTLARYRKEGVLRGTRLSGRVLYTLPEIMAFLKKQTEAVPT